MKKFFLLALVATQLSACVIASSGRSRLTEYEVQRGDTLYEISQRYSIDWRELARFNGISNPNNLAAGQMLMIPQAYDSSESFIHQDRKKHEEIKFNDDRIEMPRINLPGINTPGRVNLAEAKHFIGKLSSPLERGVFRFNSKFGYRGTSFHEGIDLAAEPGTQVYAAHAGEVVYAGEGMSGYGKILAIRSGPIMTVYAHNQSLEVRFGEIVEQGQKIAKVGSSGRASGPHLHFEMRVRTTDGRYAAVNPMIFYP